MLDYFDDLVPVKDGIATYWSTGSTVVENMDQHVLGKGAKPGIPAPSSNEQRNVGKWTRQELEDRYFRIYDDSLILKKHGQKQEDKIKRLTTKLLRLISDRKKLDQGFCKDGNAKKRDIETEQLIEEMQDRIRELERNNKLVHEKLIVSRQQLAMQLKRPVPSPYRHISSRLDTGILKPAMKIQESAPHVSVLESHSPYTGNARSPVVENVKSEVIMGENIALLRRQINAYEQELQSLKETLHVKETEHDDELVAVKSQVTQDQRQHLLENISVIRLQRELKQRASQLMALELHCANLDKNIESSRKSHEEVLLELDALGQELKNEQQRNLTLQDEMRVLVSSSLVIAELKEKNSDLENENKILKESNNDLINSGLHSANQQSCSDVFVDPMYRSRIMQLETALSNAKEEKDSLIKANKEHDKEMQKLHFSYSNLQVDYDDLKNKINFFSKDGAFNFGELQEALTVIRQRKESSLQSQISTVAVDQEDIAVVKQQLLKAQADHVETINELEKTRNLLVAQHRITQDCQQEVENVSNKLSKVQGEYENRISDQTHMLDRQAASIQRLELQLKNIECSPNNDNLNMSSNTYPSMSETSVVENNAVNAVNDMHIKIIRCSGIHSCTGKAKVSAYCVYKFHSKPDHTTAIVTCTSNPEFNDHMTYRFDKSSQLDDYLKTQALEIYVFDDNDPRLSAYLGMATIPLFQLVNDKIIEGKFELKMADGKQNGNIEISVYRQFAHDIKQNITIENNCEEKLPENNVKQKASLPPKPMPRTLLTSQQFVDDTIEKTDKKPPLFPREIRKKTMQHVMEKNPIPITPKPQLAKGNSPLSSLSVSVESSSESESDAVVIATGLNKNTQRMKIEFHNVNDANGAAVGIELGDDDHNHDDDDDESDSDIVVSAGKNALLGSNMQTNHQIIIIVSHLTLLEHAAILKDDNVQMLFVEYRFLDFSPEELETPFALPKPKPNQKIAYNFRKVFDLSPEKSVQRRQCLTKIISSPSKSRLKFTVVSEPLEDSQDIDCEDVGYSYVDLNKILRNRKDIIEKDIGVYDVTEPTLVIGHLNITVKAFSVLQSL